MVTARRPWGRHGRQVHVTDTPDVAGQTSAAGSIWAARTESAGRLLSADRRLRTIIDTALMAVVAMDQRGLIVDWNPMAATTFGWSRDEAVGRPLADLIVPVQHRQAHTEGLRRWMRTGEGAVLGNVITITALRRSGEEFPVELAISPASRDGDDVLFTAFIRDITELQRHEKLRAMQFAVTRALSGGDQLDPVLIAVLEAIGRCLGFEAGNVWIADAAKTRLTWSLGWAETLSPLADFHALSGISSMSTGSGLPGQVYSSGVPAAVADVMEYRPFLRREAAARTGLRGAFAFPLLVGGRTSGVMEFFTCASRTLEPDQLAVMADLGAQVGQFIERMRAEAGLRTSLDRLSEIAATDALTGLRNRREFERMLATIPRRRFAILALDVDDLKRVNDEYGHEAGDVVLRAVALTFAAVLRGWDVVARLGGDEFAAVLLDVDDAQAEEVAERVLSAMRSIAVPFGPARVSVGWAAAPAGADPHAIWRVADAYLFTSKRSGRDCATGGRSAASSVSHAPAGSRWSELVTEVLSSRALGTVYQPVVLLDGRRILGHEALARPLGHGPRASVSQFFSAAQRMGRSRDIDWLCRRLAIERAAWGTDPSCVSSST